MYDAHETEEKFQKWDKEMDDNLKKLDANLDSHFNKLSNSLDRLDNVGNKIDNITRVVKILFFICMISIIILLYVQ